MNSQLVGFIGGGQMAQALASGAVAANVFSAENLVFVEPNAEQRRVLKSKWPAAHMADTIAEVLAKCPRVVLAVKPHVLKTVAPEIAASATHEHLLVSIAAGISLTTLQDLLGTSKIIRVMPNTPAQVNAGAAAIATPPSVAEDDVTWVESLMNSVGTSVRVADHLMHAVTGVAGSSPAYIYLVIEALSDGGVAMGLARDTSTRLAAQSVLGAAKMVLESGLHPGQLKDQVTSPGGTTMAAVRELEASGIRSAFIEAVARCAERSEELGQQ